MYDVQCTMYYVGCIPIGIGMADARRVNRQIDKAKAEVKYLCQPCGPILTSMCASS